MKSLKWPFNSKQWERFKNISWYPYKTKYYIMLSGMIYLSGSNHFKKKTMRQKTYPLGGVERVIKKIKIIHIWPLQDPIRPDHMWCEIHIGYIHGLSETDRSYQNLRHLSDPLYDPSNPYTTHNTFKWSIIPFFGQSYPYMTPQTLTWPLLKPSFFQSLTSSIWLLCDPLKPLHDPYYYI